MATYNVVYLTCGQIPPDGSTGIMLSNGGLMWYGDNFPGTATLGEHVETDPLFDTTYTYSAATAEETTEYETLASGIGQ